MCPQALTSALHAFADKLFVVDRLVALNEHRMPGGVETKFHVITQNANFAHTKPKCTITSDIHTHTTTSNMLGATTQTLSAFRHSLHTHTLT